MAATVEVSPPAPPLPTKHVPNDAHTPSCPSCGSSINMTELQDARQRIEELEAQMERLKEKATAAGTLPIVRQAPHHTGGRHRTDNPQSTDAPTTKTKYAASMRHKTPLNSPVPKPHNPISSTRLLAPPSTPIPHVPQLQAPQRPLASPSLQTAFHRLRIRGLCLRLRHRKTLPALPQSITLYSTS
jgi:hypothetical protein